MKKIAKYLIIPLFSIFAFFLLFNTNVSATGVLVPDDGSGGTTLVPGYDDITANPPISGEELYEQCHTYITTNIISAESLAEALGDKIYTSFTQEDCMEMINIASKREVIKNLFNFSKLSVRNSTVDYDNETVSVTQYNGNAATVQLKDLANVEVGQTYVLSATTTSTNKFVYLTGTNTLWYYGTSRTIIESDLTSIIVFYGANNETHTISNIQIEKGTKKTPYVSYDYHREYYQEGIDYADCRVNTNSTSYTQGVTDADNRVNTDSTNYKAGVSSGYEKAVVEGKSLGTFIPNLLGGFGSFFLTILNIDILGFNLLTVFGIIVAVAGVIIILKIVRG